MLTSSFQTVSDGHESSLLVDTRNQTSAIAVPPAVSSGWVIENFEPSWRPLAMISLPALPFLVAVMVLA